MSFLSDVELLEKEQKIILYISVSMETTSARYELRVQALVKKFADLLLIHMTSATVSSQNNVITEKYKLQISFISAFLQDILPYDNVPWFYYGKTMVCQWFPYVIYYECEKKIVFLS